LWSDRIEVFLGAASVELRRIPPYIRRGRTESVVVPCGGEAGVPDWRASVEALARGLAEHGWTRGDADVAISGHFVRYALVPPVPGLRRSERTALARQQFEQTYGEAASGWHIAIDDSANGTMALAAAVDAELVEQLVAVLRGVGLRPRAIEPIFARAYNAFRRAIDAPAAWIAVTEPGRACVAHLAGGAWRALRNQRIDGPLASALPALLEQTRLSFADGTPPGTVYLIGPEEGFPMQFSSAADWRINSLGPIV
jgi:hypothetical protein